MNQLLASQDQPVPLLAYLTRFPIIGFGVIGAISTALDIGTYNLLLALHANLYLATATGFTVGATNGYILNSLFVFRRNRSAGRYSSYLSISFLGLLYTLAIIHQVHVVWQLTGPNGAKLIAVAIVFAWNYFANKWVTFR